MYVLVTLATLISSQMVRPPMHRAWTIITGENTHVYAVRNGTAFFTSRLEAGAIDLATGNQIWNKKTSTWNMGAAVGDKELFVLTGDEKTTSLFAYDLKTGTERNLGTYEQGTSDIACDARAVYILRSGMSVEAIDATSGKSVWNRPISDKKAKGMTLASMTAGHGKVFAAVEGPGFICLDAASGKVLWKDNAEYGVYEPPFLLPGGVLTGFKGLQLRDYETGAPIWSQTGQQTESVAFAGDVLICEENDKIVGHDLKTGDLVWTGPDGEEGFRMGSDSEPGPSDADGALVSSKEFMRVSKTGQVEWSSKIFFSGRPVYADDKMMLCNDFERLLGYVSGEPKPLPTDATERKAVALKLVDEYEILDRTEREGVATLTPYATQPLIRKWAKWAIENGEGGLADKTGRGQMLYGLLTETAPVLDQMCGPEDTEALSQAIEEIGAKNSYVQELVKVLGHKGDQKKLIPAFVDRLRKNPPKPDSWSNDTTTLDAVARSNHPEAVAFMIAALKDPKAPKEWRHQAFIHLAGTGGDVGIAAVKAARGVRQARPPWESMLVLRPIRGQDLGAPKKDAKGRTWRLVSGGVLGNYSDLFLEQKTATGWSKPIFLGFSTNTGMGRQPLPSFRGIPLAKLLATEWIKLFPNDPTLTKDSDKDGLTDLVEKRLGTNPNKTDSDGDGLLDAVDPCPNTAPRVMGDREKIIAACIEAHFYGNDWGVPTMIALEGVKPFELYGYPHPAFWQTPEYKGDLPGCYGNGVNMLSFHAAADNPEEDVRGKDWLTLGPDGKTAKTMFSRYSGGLNGEGIEVRLVKVGEDWFVVDMVMRYVS